MYRSTLFDKFGGIRALADAVGVSASTVHSWKARGRVPARRQPAVLAAAQARRISLSIEDVVFPLGVPSIVAATSDRHRLTQ